MEREWKPNVEISPNCPRCGSCNTKFCYYNNYSLTQPRYFCKGCRRYWTKGGSLRNVPVGGGCRKNRRGAGKLLRSSVANGRLPNNPMGNSLAGTSTTSTIMPDGSHIDLALVYANFLSQKPDSKMAPFELPELPANFVSSGADQLVEENSFFGCHNLSELAGEICPDASDYQMCLSGSDSIRKQQDRRGYDSSSNYYALPPLPGEDIATSDQEVVWSCSQAMMVNHGFQGTQLPIGQEAEDPNSLISNWSLFDLSSDHDTFSRT